MAAKHDGKRAAANFWVAQQNLAKSKGGRPGYQPKPRTQPVRTEQTPAMKPVLDLPADAPTES